MHGKHTTFIHFRDGNDIRYIIIQLSHSSHACMYVHVTAHDIYLFPRHGAVGRVVGEAVIVRHILPLDGTVLSHCLMHTKRPSLNVNCRCGLFNM